MKIGWIDIWALIAIICITLYFVRMRKYDMKKGYKYELKIMRNIIIANSHKTKTKLMIFALYVRNKLVAPKMFASLYVQIHLLQTQMLRPKY